MNYWTFAYFIYIVVENIMSCILSRSKIHKIIKFGSSNLKFLHPAVNN